MGNDGTMAKGSVETSNGATSGESNPAQSRPTWLRVITIIGGFLLVIFGVLIMAVLPGTDGSSNESLVSLANLFVITTMVILPITTGLYLLIVFGFRKKTYAYPSTVETVLSLVTGSVWIISGFFTAAVSIRNLNQGRSATAPVILIIASACAIAAGFVLAWRLLRKRSRNTGGKA